MKIRAQFAWLAMVGLILAGTSAAAQESQDGAPSSVSVTRLGIGFVPLYSNRTFQEPRSPLRLQYQVAHNPALARALDASHVAIESVVDLAFFEGCAATICVLYK